MRVESAASRSSRTASLSRLSPGIWGKEQNACPHQARKSRGTVMLSALGLMGGGSLTVSLFLFRAYIFLYFCDVEELTRRLFGDVEMRILPAVQLLVSVPATLDCDTTLATERSIHARLVEA